MRLSGITATQGTAIREYFTNYPDQMTGPGVIAFAASNGYSVADIGSAFGSSAAETAAFANITLEQANAPAAALSAAQAATAQQELISNDIQVWSSQHPNATAAEIRAFLAYTGYTLHDVAVAAGITDADAEARLAILEQQAAAVAAAAANVPTTTAAQNIATAQATYAADLAASGVAPAVITEIIAATNPTLTTTTAPAVAPTAPVVTVGPTATPPQTVKQQIIAYFDAHPSEKTPAGIKAFMVANGITLAQIADAGGVSLADASQYLNPTVQGATETVNPPPTTAPNWIAWLTAGAALVSILK